MKNVLTLTIITCTYNSEKYLEQCLKSIEEQQISENDFEHIFVDGYSTDATIRIIQDYKKRNPKINIKIISAEPKGVYNAMNIGIENAKGKYLYFLNSDDYLEPNILGRLPSKVSSNADVYYGELIYLDNGRRVPLNKNRHRIKNILGHIGLHCLLHHQASFIKKSLFDELGTYDESKKIASDYGFWLKCIKHRKTLEYFPFYIANFRIHAMSLSSSGKHEQRGIEEMHIFRREIFGIYGEFLHFVGIFIKRITGGYM